MLAITYNVGIMGTIESKHQQGNNMNALKIKTKVSCNTCGCALNRSKTIKVSASTQDEAKSEAAKKINEWKAGLKGQNCKTCESIIKDLAA